MRFYLVILIIISYFNSYASHIVGGEIYYDYLGGNQYRISISLYRDCFSTGAAYDDPLSLGIFTSSNQLVQNVLIPFSGSANVPISFSNPCVVPPNDICIEKTTYVTTVNLPQVIGGYTLAYQRCCRGPNVVNLVSPDDTGITLATHIPGSDTGLQANSSPRFSGYPPTILCNNEDLVFNHSATDPDGDVLVYSLVAPNSGANSSSPMPNPPPPPAYAPVNWLGSFSTSNPLGTGATININSATGILTASPQMLGLFVVGIRVQEYRGGVLVGSTIRDFLFRVINCNITLQANLPLQEDMGYFISYCQGLSVTFDNNSFGATNYGWDFGVTNSTSDVSSQFEPTFTYPTPGTYQVTLVANPGWPCSDTSIQTIIVNQYLEVSYTTPDSICFIGNSFNFNGSVQGTNNATYLWDFGPNASVASSTNLDVNNVVFTSTGFIPIKLNGYIGTCVATFLDSIYIFPDVNSSFAPPANYLCEGLTVTLINSTTDALNYAWDFGDLNSQSDVSSQFQPTYTYPTPGSYQIRLIGSSTGACIDTSYQTLIMNEILDVSFTSNDSLCITDNSFNFDGSMVGSPTTTFDWDFGPNASTTSSTNLDVNNVVFDTPGTIPISLIGNYGTCTDKYETSIFIFREPTIDFGLVPGLQCVPFEAHFVNLSTADSPLIYEWDFGDGGVSNVESPIYLYEEVGAYDVTLAIYALVGCVDTLTLINTDLIDVKPRPVSDFSVSPPETDICHSMIQFTDKSTGGLYTHYSFDGVFSSDERNPSFSYLDDGTFYPIQISVNEFGCSDTSRQKVYIAPFIVYFPNAFTPDDDEFNNEFSGKVALQIVEWDFNVYNRWGEKVFNSTNPDLGWDGNYKGKEAQDGLYTYRLRYVSCEIRDSIHEITGHFSLLR